MRGGGPLFQPLFPRNATPLTYRQDGTRSELIGSPRPRLNNRSGLMKLNSTQVKQTLGQMNAHVLPDDHPAVTQLTDVFGDHTFFLDEGGLKVLEPNEAPEAELQSGEVLSLADWTDATLTSLKPHAPEPTGTIVVFRERKH
jgi:hypothetical protein